jgi:hypothetical protein
MYAALEALEFPNSPPMINIGRPFTMRRLVVPCGSKWGTAAAVNEPSAKMRLAKQIATFGTGAPLLRLMVALS